MNAPSTGFMLEAGIAQMHAHLNALRAAYRAEPKPAWEKRETWLKALEKVLLDNQEAIIEAINDDFGHRAAEETRLLELFGSVEGVHYALKHGPQWMRRRHRGAGPLFKPASAYLEPQPLGVIGIVVPWNYPLYLAVGPLINALAAGNRAFIKMSEYSPRIGELLDRMLHEALGPDVVRVINGGPDLAAAFTALPFDHLIFTGSTAVGKHVMRAAADNLTPVTLELGGKSPALITEQTTQNASRFENAVKRIMVGKALNAGQTCVAPDYALVPRGQVDAFKKLAQSAVADMYPEGASDPTYTSISSDRQHQRLSQWLEEAREKGAQVVPIMAAQKGQGRKMPVTLVLNAPADCKVAQEELFGPVLLVVPYDTLSDALNHINDRPRPLAMYLFDDNKATQAHVLDNTVAGGVSINEMFMHVAQESLPFGGVGPSGIGSYHGQWGFDRFSNLKPVFEQARFNGAGLISPPYSNVFHSAFKFLLRKK